MGISLLRRLSISLVAGFLLGGSNLVGLSAPPPATTHASTPPGPVHSLPGHEPTGSQGVEYEPLQPGAHFVYEDADGLQFVRKVMQPAKVIWFDGTVKEVVPVFDGRLGGYYLYVQSGRDVLVIGVYQDGRLDRWGEYIPVMTSEAVAANEPVTTPAGDFGSVRVMMSHGMRAWYAKGVGLVRTDAYELLSHTIGSPETIELSLRV